MKIVHAFSVCSFSAQLSLFALSSASLVLNAVGKEGNVIKQRENFVE
jgi:hypothetical protein